MHRYLRSFCIFAAASLPMTALAGFTQNPILSTSLVIAEPDSDRLIDDNAIGLKLGLAKLVSPNLLLELQVGFNEYDANNDDLKQANAGLEANWLLFSDASAVPYLVLGAGIQQSETNASNSDTNNPYADIGIGVFHQVSPNGAMVRADMRMRRDFFDSPNTGRADYDDFIAHVGFAFPLGKPKNRTTSDTVQAAPSEPQTPAATQEHTPAAEAPAPEIQAHEAPATSEPKAKSSDDSDSDRDGIKDIADYCPNTTPHAAVDINGCSRKQNGEATRRAPTLMAKPASKQQTQPAAKQQPPVAAPVPKTATPPAKAAPEATARPIVKPHASVGTIGFVENTSVISSRGRTTLAYMAQQIHKQNLQAEITGGGAEQRLKATRANAVKQYLLKYGVPSSRIQINSDRQSNDTVVRLQTP